MKKQAMERAMVVGVLQAAQEFNIPDVTLRHWLKRHFELPPSRPPRAQYDDEKRAAAVLLAKTNGARSASEATGIPYQTLVRWVRHPTSRQSRATFTPEFRATAVALASRTSCKQAAIELGLNRGTLGAWIAISKPVEERKTHRGYTQAAIDEAVSLAGRIGVIAAAHELDIPEGTLRNWEVRVREPGAKGKRTIRPYTHSFKEAALRLLSQEGTMAASKQLNVSPSLLRKWAKAAGVRPPKVVGRHNSWDTSMEWLTRAHPTLEDWRCLAESWLATKSEALAVRLTSLAAFFQNYIIKQKLTHHPEELLSRFYQAPPGESAFPDTRHGKVCRNYSHEFLDWVLKTRFSERDEEGRVLFDPLFRNPLTKASFAGDHFDKESRFSPLPYTFLVECRRIIAQGPNFKDWTWAQSQLGVEVGAQGGVAPEWFEVPESLIDKDDPDCVWRKRLRSRAAGGPRFEIWSPVRWVAQLVKCILPLRTLQVRVLDSGEADTWRYDLKDEAGAWTLSGSRLRTGTPTKPTERGVFRRPSADLRDTEVQLPERWSNAVLYINTNKTADSKRSGAKKGYVLPWMVEGGLESDPFYWLVKLRNWQEKYNPLPRATSWHELDGRHIRKKSDVQLAGFPDTCFLFRTPEERTGQPFLPLGDGALDYTWYAVLSELETRLRQTGKTNIDGSPIRLVVGEGAGAKRTLFPPHSVRVSLVTALADAGVPLPILMRLLGHSRLAMTIYYHKKGQVEVAKHLESAFNDLKTKGAALLTDWLKNADHQKLLHSVISNDEASLAGVIPTSSTARNSIGWMPMSFGLCIVGGNTYPMEGGGATSGGCYNGGPNLGSEKRPKFAPVPGGARNCVRCRWLVSAPHYLPALVDHCNVQLYHFHEARASALAADRRYQELVAFQIECEKSGESGPSAIDIREACSRAEASILRFEERAEDVVATMRLIERCRIALTKKTDAAKESQKLLAVGGCRDVEVALFDFKSELEQLEAICELVEIYPEVDAPAAVFRRAQLIDAALSLEGMPPTFFALNKEDQLRLGNELLNRLARSLEPDCPRLGKSRVVEIMSAGECLSKHLHLDVKSLVSDIQRPPIVKRLRGT